jgi:hypothetical protein
MSAMTARRPGAASPLRLRRATAVTSATVTLTVTMTVTMIGLLGLAACSESTTSTPEATEPGTASTPVAATSTTSSTTTTIAPTTTAAATTTSSSTTSTSSTTTTTISPVVRELVLRLDGVGQAAFGADPDGVVEYVQSLLGAPTGDTGWVDPSSFALCPGNEVRRVDWGVLSLLFSDETPVAAGRRHFFAWEYGREDQLGAEPQGLATSGGTTLGSRVVDLRAEFPDVAVNPGEEDGVIPPNFYLNDNFRGLLTGAADDDVVTVMFGGYGCGA